MRGKTAEGGGAQQARACLEAEHGIFRQRVNPLQYSCLENPMDRGAWWAIYSPWGHKESDTTEQLILSDILCAYYISLIKLIS